jgi:hypothetical protein
MKRGNVVYHLLERNVAIRDCIVPVVDDGYSMAI